MLPKPKHLGPDYAAQFQDRSVAAAYRYRPPYPAEVFALLAGLLRDTPQAVLDAGCGTGEIARGLIDLADRIDAVDPSQAMIEQGRAMPGGDHLRLRWIISPIENTPLQPPYALITAGASLHWMEWGVVLPRFQQMLTPGGTLAIIDQMELPNPWDTALRSLIRRYSTNQEFQPYDLIEELSIRGLFQKQGEQHTAPVPFTQSVDDYIESFHSRNGFSRQRMRLEMAAEFDGAVKGLLANFCPSGEVTLQIQGHIVWGQPLNPDDYTNTTAE